MRVFILALWQVLIVSSFAPSSVLADSDVVRGDANLTLHASQYQFQRPAQQIPQRRPQGALHESEAHVHGSHSECPLPKSAMDVVRCAQREHPSVRRAKLANEYASTLTGVARKLPNPDLEIEAAGGESAGERRIETKISVLQTFELGEKRSARALEAQARQVHAAAEQSAAEANVILLTVLKLHRLRQLEEEKETLQEAVDTFNQVVRQQRARVAFTPEQRVSLSVFRMALAEAKLRQAELSEEERSLEHYFHVSTGHSLEELKAVLPQVPAPWPEPKSLTEREVLSPDQLRAQAEREIAAAELKGAESNLWPDLRIGPLVQIEEDMGRRSSIFGLQLSLPLPVWQGNNAVRSRAAHGLLYSEKLSELLQAEERHERAEQLRIYEHNVLALKESPSMRDIQKEHKLNESFARRGLVSASLLIEAHRQIEDLIKGRHARELKALEALWNIYKFDGRILSESL